MNAAELIRYALDWAFIICLAYCLSVYGFYFVAALVSVRKSRSLIAQSDGEDYGALADSAFSIPVSVIATVFNEEVVVIGAVKSLLAFAYPEFEVLVVNDGSADSTLELLKREFELEPHLVSHQDIVATEQVRATYRSRTEPKLLVIDKAPSGKKADPLNCGLNYARYRYLCSVDGDTFYSPDALLRAMRLVVKDPARVVGVTSMIAVSRHPGDEARQVRGSVRYDTTPLLAFQQLDYMRSFLATRLAWSRFNCMMGCSGAFGLWRRDTVVAVGGFSREFSCEDIEITFRIHNRLLREGRPYRILSLSDTIARTEAPSTASGLILQRARWQRVVMEVVWHYREMFANPRFRSVGLIALPYFVFAEAYAIAFQLLAIVALAGAVSFGTVQISTFAQFTLIMALALGILSLVALLVQDLSFRELEIWTLVRLALLTPFDLFLYRPVIFVAQMRGLLQYLSGNRGWDKFQRNVRRASTPASV